MTPRTHHVFSSQMEDGNALETAIRNWRGTLTDLAAGGQTIGVAEILAGAGKLTRIWRDMGVEPGAVVLVATGNSHMFLCAVLSLCATGAVPIPMSTTAPPKMMATLVSLLRPAAMIVPSARAQMIARTWQGDLPIGIDGRLSIVPFREGSKANATLANTVALLSSGMTGMPNAIIHAPASLVQNATMHAKAVGLRPRDRFLLAIPCYFSYGFVAGILGAIIADADIVMTDYPMLPIMWHDIVRSNAITVFSATPSLFRKLFAEGRFPASLRMVTLGGDATSSADLKSLWQVFDGTVHLTYGLSEAGPRVFTRTLSVPGGEKTSQWSGGIVPLRGGVITSHWLG